jgi:hypothetical protein
LQSSINPRAKLILTALRSNLLPDIVEANEVCVAWDKKGLLVDGLELGNGCLITGRIFDNDGRLNGIFVTLTVLQYLILSKN